MKKLLLFILIFTTMGLFGNKKEKEELPDFNFPKTVIKDAEAQLKKALANADGEATVDALVKYSIAKSSISEETFDEVTTKLNEVIAKEKREDYRAILHYLQSMVYSSHEDQTEADSCLALIFDNDEKLKEYKIENYQKIIKSDNLGRRLCPTLRDFLRYKHLGISAIIESLEDGEMQGFKMINRYDSDVKDAYNELKEYAEKYPKSPWINDIKNRIHEIEAQSASASYPQQWHSSMPITIEVSSHNANNVTIELYRFPKLEENQNRAPFYSLRKICAKDLTFQSVTTLFDKKQDIVLDPLPEGIYYVDVIVNGKSNHREDIYTWQALKIQNTAKYEVSNTNPDSDSTKVITVDIKSGEFVKEEMVKEKYKFRYSQYDTSGDLKIFTDLGIYRPGETIHYTLIYKKKTPEARQAMADQSFMIEFNDLHGKKIASDTLATDKFGQLAGEFTIPTNLTNGRFSIYAQHINGVGRPATAYIDVIVSEYKTPTFYIDLSLNPLSFEKDKDVTLRGKALTYSGIPLTNIEVQANIRQQYLWWRYRDDDNGFEPLSMTATTNENGEFSLTVTKEQINTTFGYFKASFMVTDEAGESQEANCSFYVGSNRSLVYSGDQDFINDKPIKLPISLMSSDPNDKSATFEYAIYDNKKVLLKQGSLTTDAPVVDLRDLKSGTYFLEAGFKIVANGMLDDDEDILKEIVIYRPNDKTCPKESPLWIPSCGEWVDDKGVAHITIGTAYESHIYYVANSRLGFVKDGWLNYKPGMHEFTIPIPKGDDQYISLSFRTYHDCNFYSKDTKLIYQPSANKLSLGISSFRDKIVPGGIETWTFTLKNRNGKPVDGRLALEVISEAVNQIQPNSWNYHSNYLNTYKASISTNNFNGQYTAHGYWQEKSLKGAKYQLPELNLYDHHFFWGLRKFGRRELVFSMAAPEEDNFLLDYDWGDAKSYSAMSRSTKLAKSASRPQEAYEEGVSLDDENEIEGDGALTTGSDAEEMYNNVRESETKVALWKPMVNIGENGEVSVEFEAPSDNTTWRLNAFAFNSETESNALTQTMLAQRRVMVKPSLPRFLRSGDKTTLMANVMNSSEEEVSAKITLITFDPRTNKFIDQKTLIETIPANSMKAVGIEAEALDYLTNLGLRVIAEEISAEGKTLASDGEQQMIPVLPAVARVVETIPFYLNPTEGDSIIDFSHLLSLNNNVKPEDVEITFEYCNNPVWYCISALPTIYDADNKTATGIAHNLYAVSLAKYLADKNAFNISIPFDEETLTKIIKTLGDLQNPDGGLSWFDWERRESSEYVTYVVLELIGELNRIFSSNNYQFSIINSQFVKDALKYYEKKQLENLAEMKKHYKKVNYNDFAPYLYLRTLYPTAEYPLPSENASLLKKTLDACEKNWREFSLPSRGFLAITLFRNGKEKTARTIIESLRQFAMTDARRGMFWDNLQSFGYRWYSRTALTALMLEAFDEVDSRLEEIDEIRKWILLEKQTTDWGNSSMAAEATYALISTGSQWLKSEESEYTKISLDYDGLTKETNNSKLKTENSKLIISHEKGAPAWGAVYAKFPTEISKAKAFKLDEISISKELFKYDGGKVKSAKDVKVGDKIQVQLTIKTDRDMQYVTIHDNRAACFEPVDKKSGYRYSDSNVKNRQSIGYYLDTKDSESRILINFLPKGEHVITYDVYVTNHGTFCTGIADVTCEYAPQFTAHSAGNILKSKE